MSTHTAPRSDHLEALEVISDLLLGIEDDSQPDAFFSSLCAAICRQTALRRAVLFRYDKARARVRAVGAHGIDIEQFRDLYVTIDSAPIVRRSLLEDRVLEVQGSEDFRIPPALKERLEGVPLVCTPMRATGHCVGVVIGERDPLVPEMSERERTLLRTLGKAIAMASVARGVTAYHERSKQLQQRIDLAREIHEGVVQRLFGVSLALSRSEQLDRTDQDRCAAEVQTALSDLRSAVQRPLGHRPPPTTLSFAEELDRQRLLHPETAIEVLGNGTHNVPAEVEPLAQSLLREAMRNVRKHSSAEVARISMHEDAGTFTLEVQNDGVEVDCSNGAEQDATVGTGTRGGIGLHVAGLEALAHGGVLEYGQPRPGTWQLRLLVPVER